MGTEGKSATSKLFDQFGDVVEGKGTPSIVGAPVFAKHMEIVKCLVGQRSQDGKVSLPNLFGKKLANNDETSTAIPVNYGSRKSTTFNSGDVLPEDTRLLLMALKKSWSNATLQADIKYRGHPYGVNDLKAVPCWKTFESMAKAFNVTDYAEWLDQVQARFFFEEYEIPLMLADQFDQLPMTSPIVRVPGELGLLEGELELDTGTFTEQTNTESSYLVESKNNVVHQKITQDLLDDSAPPLIDKRRKEGVRGVARALERSILDGDDSGTHIDADTDAGSAKLFTKAYKGLRRRAFDNETLIGGEEIVFDLNDSPSKDMFSGLMKRLKCQNAEKSDLMYILGCSVAADLVTGAIPELFTAFAMGSVASNVTGMVPPVFGIGSVESSMVREDLETTGKALASPTDTKTYALIVQKSRFNVWVRQAIRVWASPSLPSSDHMLMTSKARHAFAGIPQSAKERSVAMAINVKTV